MLCDELGLCLLARRKPSSPYVLCGRLRPVAVGYPDGSDEPNQSGKGEADAVAMPVWAYTTSGDRIPAPHIVFELVDAAELFQAPELVDELFGSTGISPVPPAFYLPRW